MRSSLSELVAIGFDIGGSVTKKETIMPRFECYHEIKSQPDALCEALEVTLAKKKSIISFFRHANPDKTFFAGCTSPYYIGCAAAPLWRVKTGVPCDSVPSSELLLYPELYYTKRLSKPILIAMSRSGKTSETIWAVEEYNQRFPGRTTLIGCNPEGPLVELSTLQILLPKSAEKTIPQTRSWSATYCSTLLMAGLIAADEKLIHSLQESPAIVETILRNNEAPVQQLFEKQQFSNMFFLGSGSLFGVAREGAMKCMEMASIDAFSYPFLETRHGPRALIDSRTLVIGLCSHAGFKYEMRLLEELSQVQGATTLALVPAAFYPPGSISNTISVNVDWEDGFLGLAYIPILQLLAYYCATSKNLNPDLARFHSPFVEIDRL